MRITPSSRMISATRREGVRSVVFSFLASGLVFFGAVFFVCVCGFVMGVLLAVVSVGVVFSLVVG